MTRINDHQVIQRVEDVIVIFDESTGNEVALLVDDMVKIYRAITGLIVPERPSTEKLVFIERFGSDEDIATQMGHPGGHYG